MTPSPPLQPIDAVTFPLPFSFSRWLDGRPTPLPFTLWAAVWFLVPSRVSVRAKTDPAWGYAQHNGTRITCLLCSHTFADGGISRFKNHLAGVSGNIRACPKAPPNVRAAMLKNLSETKKNQTLAAQKRSFSEMTRGDSSSEPHYSDDTPGSNEDTTPIHSPNPCPRPGGSLLQPNIKSALRGKDAALRTDLAIARFWYEHCLPFNVVASPSVPVLINMIASMGAGYTGPSHHAIRTTLLDDIYAECKLTVDSMRIQWKNFGCTIIADGWTDNRQRSLINFLIYSPKGISFVKSVDASGFSKTSKNLFELFDSVIQWVGVQNVVQVVTDNASNYVAAGKMINARRVLLTQ